MPTTKRSFEAWLATLSLDAAHTDLCPNLAYIPLSQLRRLYAEGCAPDAGAISKHQWKRRAPRVRRSLMDVSTEALLEEAARRGLPVVQVHNDRPRSAGERSRIEFEEGARRINAGMAAAFAPDDEQN